MNKNLDDLMEKIEYNFKDQSILLTALTHRSFAFEHAAMNPEHNERLEFLGDAVLELVTTDFLYRNYGEKSEGEMTKIRASLVCEQSLAMDAKTINLPDFIYLGKGEEMTDGRNKDSIVSDCLESLIGAIYIDGGISKATTFINNFILDNIESKALFHDSKSILQERVQEGKLGTVTYVIVDAKGPDHDKTYYVEARLDDKVIGKGVGKTKKRAEQQAAYNALSNNNNAK